MKSTSLPLLLALITLATGQLIASDPPSFRDADKNKDGKLDYSEFSTADKGRKGGENTSQMFTKTDSDGDKFISPQEFAPYRIRREFKKKK